MFTGIIQSIGSVTGMLSHGDDLRLTVDTTTMDLAGVRQGDSVAVAGVCLTVALRVPQGFVADVSRETLAVTTISSWQVGSQVNLEAALRAGDALGGHLVSGHIDGCAELLDRGGDARSQRLRFRAPASLQRFIARKGSVTLDGVSLTVNEVDGAEFEVNLIPHTLAVTTLNTLSAGALVNLEVDLIARYAERLMAAP